LVLQNSLRAFFGITVLRILIIFITRKLIQFSNLFRFLTRWLHGWLSSAYLWWQKVDHDKKCFLVELLLIKGMRRIIIRAVIWLKIETS
jgi:hypothetical protein